MRFTTFLCFVNILRFFIYVACLDLSLLGIIQGILAAPSSSSCEADKGQAWSYRGNNAAKYWGKLFKGCSQKRQSPIDIRTTDAEPKPTLGKLYMRRYDSPLTAAKVENNGHSISVTPTDGVERAISVKGSTYKLVQFHFHWGDDSDHGSEHTINGKEYALELHFVHANSDNELAVAGILFKEGDKDNEALGKITDTFSKVMYSGDHTELKKKVDLEKLLPSNPSSFYRYDGSLTTPECNEGVTWSVLTKVLPVGKDQMKQFRKLYSTTKEKAAPACKLSNNYRPVQPLNQRKVYRSK